MPIMLGEVTVCADAPAKFRVSCAHTFDPELGLALQLLTSHMSSC